jgi:pyruvate dehydrogenase E1 component
VLLAPVVTVLDGHPQTPAVLVGINQLHATHLCVTGFGQSGDFDAVHHHGLDTDSVVAPALAVVQTGLQPQSLDAITANI